MRPYTFIFRGGRGREDCEANYLIDLDKVAAIGAPYFDSSDWIAYVKIYFSYGQSIELRALTGYAVMPGFEDNGYGHEDKEFQKEEFERFTDTVNEMKKSWTSADKEKSASA